MAAVARAGCRRRVHGAAVLSRARFATLQDGELRRGPAKRSVYKAFESQKPYHKERRDAGPEVLMQAQMYTPEALQTEGLTVNCYRLVAYGLQMPELLDRYGKRAAELSASMKPSQFSVILNAFARAEHRHEQMIKAFTKRMPPRLPHFVPMDLSQVCNAYAKLRERDEVLFRRFSSEMPHKLPLFEGYQLGKVANAYARLSMREDLLFDDIADEIIRRPQDLDAPALLLVANAFAHFRIQKPRLWAVLADWLIEAHLDLEPADIALVLNAYSTVGFHHDGLFGTLLRSVSEPQMLQELEPSRMGLVINALARLQLPSGEEQEATVRVLIDHAASQLVEFTASGVTQLLNACAQLPFLAASASLVDGLLGRAREHVPDFNAQSLSLLVHACAKLRQRDVPLLTQVAKAVPACAADFTPQALAVTAHGFAKLEVRSEILFYLLAQEMIEKMPLFTGQGVGMLLWAYGRLQIKNERLVQACKKQLRALSDELTLAEVDSAESGLRALEALDGSTEAFLQRQRQAALGETRRGGTGQSEDDFLSAQGARLLKRISEEEAQDDTWTREQGPAPLVSEQSRRSSAVERNLPEEDSDSTALPPGDSEAGDERPDLWSMLGEAAESEAGARGAQGAAKPSGSSQAGATSPTQLREYLARPERIGRRPVVLDGSASSRGADLAPGAENDSDRDARSEPEPKRGRRSRRRA